MSRPTRRPHRSRRRRFHFPSTDNISDRARLTIVAFCLCAAAALLHFSFGITWKNIGVYLGTPLGFLLVLAGLVRGWRWFRNRRRQARVRKAVRRHFRTQRPRTPRQEALRLWLLMVPAGFITMSLEMRWLDGRWFSMMEHLALLVYLGACLGVFIGVLLKIGAFEETSD